MSAIRDITEQKKLEANLRQAQKLEAVGTLAGGIAHDFNNILMGIQGRVSMMLAELDSSHPHYDHLKGIETYVKSATGLTGQLLGFAKGGKYEVKPTDMNTLFTIYLPASDEEVAEDAHPTAQLVKGHESILLVDDEDMVLEVGRQMLGKLGYHVLTAKSGRMALDILKSGHTIIDLIILDMIMPEISGGETFDRIRQIAPGKKVLLSSGYSINGQAIEILRRGCDGFIQKPFGLNDLSQKIRQVLGKQ